MSRDDDPEGESNGIQNQKKIPKKYATEYGYKWTRLYVDDGVSGTTFVRPDFQKMLQTIQGGIITAVFVKALSRLRRDYHQVGYHTEEFFPDHDVRFVAVNDGVDSLEGENKFAPFRNIINGWCARDASRKIRMSQRLRGNSGEPLSHPPYGYQKDPENSKRWVVDPEPAEIVRRIYQMYLSGYGVDQIGGELLKEEILSPLNYWKAKGLNRGGRVNHKSPYYWNHSTITQNLPQREYLGDVINFKTYSRSYKDKTRHKNPEENQVVFEGVHEPIIDRETWDRAQAKRGKVRAKRRITGERNMFSGLLVCATCGSNLNYHFNQGNPDN